MELCDNLGGGVGWGVEKRFFMADLCGMAKDNTDCKAIILQLKVNFKKIVGYFLFLIWC